MNTINASTGFSPFQLHLGRSPRILPPLFDDAILQTSSSFPMDADSAAKLLRQIDTDVLEAQDNLLIAKLAQAQAANRERGPEPSLKEGDLVMLSTVHRRREYMQRGSNRVAKFMTSLLP
ncbi:hypothetical protein K466DRAFT_579278 [Polyporus arcularius HHB13444]|uniref:Uncharacterized protein n=1 Tax=Polyporus arcularius HHB13444 TaxID=1314778 RepID=A0A5C3NMY9_9APHY|nr:hypothetical protein K466DRAFT_579278 [Polyporus arcularius HHB13444]